MSKTLASELGPNDWYRVSKGARDALPSVLPDAWECVQRAENARIYKRRGGVMVIAEVEMVDGETWLHVSFSRADRLPSWEDLREVKDLFIGRSRKAVQVLPPEAEYVNIHPFVLHLYANLERDPLPDFRMAGGI